MQRGHGRDLHAAHRHAAAEARQHRVGRVAPARLEPGREERRHLAAGDDPGLLGERDVDHVGLRRRHRQVGLRAGARARRLDVRLADVVAMHVADQHDVDLSQPRVGAAGHGVARVVEHAGAVRVLEDEGAILRAELAVDAAERRDLDGLRADGCGNDGAQRGRGGDPVQAAHAASWR